MLIACHFPQLHEPSIWIKLVYYLLTSFGCKFWIICTNVSTYTFADDLFIHTQLLIVATSNRQSCKRSVPRKYMPKTVRAFVLLYLNKRILYWINKGMSLFIISVTIRLICNETWIQKKFLFQFGFALSDLSVINTFNLWHYKIISST